MTRADHTGYIRAVASRLADEEVRVSATRLTATDGLRWAELDLDPENCPRLSTESGEIHPIVTWDEEQGWGICVQLENGDRSQTYHHGVRVAPDPDTVAWWVIGHTLENYPSRDDGPFRDRNEPSPDLESALTGFA